MESYFRNKAVVIVGASGGLGISFAKAFADQGARLLLAARNEEKLRGVSDNIIGDITLIKVDITEEASVNHLSEYAKEWSDTIDIVVNASGYDVRKSIEDHSFKEVKSTLDINLLGPILLTKTFLPLMKKQ